MELLVTAGIAAAVITTGVLLFGSITQARESMTSAVDVEIGNTVYSNFYGANATITKVQTVATPNFDRRALAEELRTFFFEDLQYSSAVFCLSRAGHTSLHPTFLNYTGTPPAIPNDFRTDLIAQDAAAGAIFTAYTTASTGGNASIFLIQPSVSGNLTIRAIYDIDLVTTTNPAGTYASVRRYVGNTFTAYYDVFYPEQAADDPRTAPFTPLLRYFPSDATKPKPFYFVWWPDPGIAPLNGDNRVETYASGDPRLDYLRMGDRTSFFMVVPQFPSQ